MSVMDELKNVVTEARRLFGEVSGKMGQIDRKVDEAVEGVPAEILRQMSRVVYIDGINGDDRNNGLSSNAPKKTFRNIAAYTPGGSALTIIMLDDCSFVDQQNASFVGSQVFIRPDDSLDKKPKIKFSGFLRDDGSYQAVGFSAYRNALINIINVIIELPDTPVSGGVTGFLSACISTHAHADVPSPLFLRLTSVDIVVPDAVSNPFRFTTGTGMVMISTNSVTAPQEWVDNWGFFARIPSASAIVNARIYHDGTSLFPST